MKIFVAGAVGAEIRKILSVRALIVFPVGAVAYAVLAFLPALTASEEELQALRGDALLSVVRGPGFVVAVGMLLLGVLVVGSEFRHATIASTLVVTPSRTRLAAAKAAATVIVASVTAIAVELVSLTFGFAFLAGNGVATTVGAADIALSIGGVIVVTVLYALAGVGLGLVVRDQTLAIGSALVWMLVIEGVIPIVLRKAWLFKWMPGGAAYAVLGIADAPPDMLPAWAGALVLLGVSGLLTGVGSARFAAMVVG